MEKMRMESPDLTAQNIEKIGALFPNCITETVDENGKPKKAINFDLLKQMLSGDVIEGSEAYEFTWVGKKAAIVEANKPIRKTLRPCKEESVNWDTTENLYIEGDNLEVLKLLQESYLGAVKMIYIDPPYNTGNDFIYRDDFAMESEEWKVESGAVDDEGNRMFRNTDSNGRFHSDWCSMMYSRLLLARNLLADDGVIFISIDDNEASSMKLILDDVFGASNFVAQLVWEKKKKGSFLAKSITNVKEYVLVYCKKMELFEGLIGEINSNSETYPCINAVNKRELRTIPAGIESKYKERNFFMPKGSEISDTTMSIVLHSDLVIKDGVLAQELVLEGNWRYSQDAMKEYAEKKELYITRDLYLRRIVNDTRYKTLKDLLPRIGDDVDVSHKADVDLDNLSSTGWGSNEDADEELRLIFGVQKLLDYPKPTRLLIKLLSSYRNTNDSVCLDFFSGSATTAHAIMKLNALTGGNRKFIMVQLPETCSEDSVAYKAGYGTICEIGKERIRRAGKKIKEENPLNTQNLDTGFRVFKLADTNMTDVYYSANEYSQDLLPMLESNVKADRTDLDLLFGCLLEWGLPLSLPYTSETIEGCTVHTYNGGDLIACFDENIPDSVVKAIAKRQPLRAVFRDSSFADSPSKINVGEVFKLLALDTRVKVI
ncbi:MAG: site-specific DNA-methyltransferase [Spirochaetaceae bacterium]|nr:site-specific DNA-methyltransferase [Spirochaetaceae bacterium]